MVEQEIYKKVKVADYQGICKHSLSDFGGAGFLSSVCYSTILNALFVETKTIY